MIILGGGPAGYTAALYASRANLEPLVIEGFQWGGQLQNTTDVENYPGYPEGIMGPEMMNQFRAQAERFGTRFITDDADRVELSDGGLQQVFLGDEEHVAKTVILAMGAEPRRLGIPGEMELSGRGVSTCGVCDGAFFKGEEVDRDRRRRLGDGGLDLHLQVRHEADDRPPPRRVPRLEDHVRARARAATNIELKTPFVARGVHRRRRRQAPRGPPAQRRDRRDRGDRGRRRVRRDRPHPALGAGRRPGRRPTRTATCAPTAKSTRTNLAGVFAVGDLVDHTYRQAVTAAGTGCMGALDAEWYLRDTPPSPEAHWLGAASRSRSPRRSRASSGRCQSRAGAGIGVPVAPRLQLALLGAGLGEEERTVVARGDNDQLS